MRYDEDKLNDIIEKIDKDKIKEFLIARLQYNKELYDDFRREFIDCFPLLSKEEYKRKINESIRSCYDRNGYISYDRTHYYTHAMYGYIGEAKKLAEKKYYNLAFDIVEIILDSIPNTDIDDSDGSTGDVADDCIEIIKFILKDSLEATEDKTIIKRILDYLINEARTEYISNYGIETYELFDFYVENKLYLKEIKEALIKILQDGKDRKYFWHSKHYIKILNEISCITKETDIIDFIKNYC